MMFDQINSIPILIICFLLNKFTFFLVQHYLLCYRDFYFYSFNIYRDLKDVKQN